MSIRRGVVGGAAAVLTTLVVLTGAPAAQSAPGGQPGPPTPVPTTPVPKPPKPKPPKPEPDTKAPPAPRVGTPVAGAGGQITVTVNAEKGSDVVIREGGALVARGKAVGGSVTLSWTTGTGEHALVARATDKAGNTSKPTPFTAEADADAPPLRDVRWTTGTPQDTRSRVAFRTAPGATYSVVVDGSTVAEGTAEKATVQRVVDLADGRLATAVTVADEVGNTRTREKPVTVRIPSLDVQVELTSEPTQRVQVITVAGTPNATRGVVRRPGAAAQEFTPRNGRATVRLRLAEGSYAGVRVVLRDPRGRSGTGKVPAFTVDTSPPIVRVDADSQAAARGKLEASVETEPGTKIAWRLVDGAGVAVTSGTLTADGQGKGSISEDVEEGDFRLVATATDRYDRSVDDSTTVRVAADPWPVWLIVLVGLGVGIAAIALLFLVALLLRRLNRAVGPRLAARREERRAALAEAAALRQRESERLAEHEEWERRSAVVGDFLHGVEQGWDVGALPGLALADDEHVRHMSVATLYDADGGAHGDAEREVVAHEGALVVTGRRLVFLGDRSAEWAVGDLGELKHVGADETVLQHSSDGDDWTALVYEDPATTRLHLDLLRAEQEGRGEQFLAERRAELEEPTGKEKPVDLSAWV